MDQERRQHRRLGIEWPVECTLNRAEAQTLRTTTGNISTGGLYFELELPGGAAEPQVNDVLQLVLTVPPGDGYSPYQGQVSSVGRVVRRVKLSGQSSEAAGEKEPARRVGLGVRFQEPLKLAF